MPEFVFTFSLIPLLTLEHLGATWESLGRRCTSPNMHFLDRKISLLCAANLRISIAQGESLFRRAGCVPAARHGGCSSPGPLELLHMFGRMHMCSAVKNIPNNGKGVLGPGRVCLCSVVSRRSRIQPERMVSWDVGDSRGQTCPARA